jgi:2-polyprenyl-3-methyl-5-hydroxy-6-metoxy-1,4-benzoquinol methylase
MKDIYYFEPSELEIALNNTISYIFLKNYFKSYINKKNIDISHKVLDYCCGSGILTYCILNFKKNIDVTFADVSNKWLKASRKKLKFFNSVNGYKINSFDESIKGGSYDKIIIHYSLHDFPKHLQSKVLNHVLNNLHCCGSIHIREPLNKSHGFKLYEIIDLIEKLKNIKYNYNLDRNFFMGEYIDIDIQLCG